MNGPSPGGQVLLKSSTSSQGEKQRSDAQETVPAPYYQARRRRFSRTGDPMRSFLMRVTSISDQEVVVVKTDGTSFAGFANPTSIHRPDLTSSFSQALLARRGGVIFLPSTVSWMTLFLARVLATLTRSTVFMAVGPESSQSSAIKTYPVSNVRLLPTAPQPRPNRWD